MLSVSPLFVIVPYSLGVIKQNQTLLFFVCSFLFSSSSLFDTTFPLER